MEDRMLELVLEELKYIRGSGDLLRAEFSTRMDKQDDYDRVLTAFTEQNINLEDY